MRRLVAIATGLLLLAGVVACGPKFPTDPPGIEGIITNAQAGGDSVTILVEVPTDELPGPASSLIGIDKASVAVTTETLLYDTDGDPVQMSRLDTGRRVRVWFSGPVAESYPVQGTASAVQLLGADEGR